MKLKLYKRVVLRVDLPDERLRKGDVAVLVDIVPHPKGGGRGCILEVFNAVGESIAVVTVPESALEPATADEVLAVRHIS